jgi:hypothetical protein
VRGYAAKIFDVAAPVGVTISTERDLVPQLVILIRPTLDGMIELRSGGSIHVFRKKDARESEIAHAQPSTAEKTPTSQPNPSLRFPPSVVAVTAVA